MTIPEPREAEQIREIYRQRKENGLDGKYGMENAAQRWMVEDRFDSAIALLSKSLPMPALFGINTLDVGCGHGDWLAHLARLGADEERLHGVDLMEDRIQTARARLPNADLHVTNGPLPCSDAAFDLITAFTVFSSIPSWEGQVVLAGEMMRALRPGGRILLYDFRYPSPLNANVHAMTQRDWARLFPGCRRTVQSLTLLPPLARAVHPRWPGLAKRLARVPFMRSHQLTLVFKDDR